MSGEACSQEWVVEIATAAGVVAPDPIDRTLIEAVLLQIRTVTAERNRLKLTKSALRAAVTSMESCDRCPECQELAVQALHVDERYT